MILQEGLFESPIEEIKSLVFLDIDGVICTDFMEFLSDDEHDFNDKCLRNLEDIVKYSGCHIVISSSWRKCNIQWIRDVFKLRGFKYPERIIGETMRGYQFVEKGCHLPIPRGAEIKSWLDQYIRYKKGEGFTKLTIPYVIIDDNSDMLLEQADNFVQTETKIGLTKKNVVDIVAILLTKQK